jgi:uncharacterized protein (DUF2236 family)
VTGEALDRARAIGDPAVDRLVARLAARVGPSESGRLLGVLFRTDGLPREEPLVSAYLDEVPPVEPRDPEVVRRGQRLFELLGPEILLLLGAYALPVAYAAGDGVQVIFRARKLKEEPVRRLCDTAQMVINVMREGELGGGQAGARSARKVRLIHALVRFHVQHQAGAPWPSALGQPINQEDQIGTLLTFSAAILHGLRRLGAEIQQADADAYIVAWSAVGRLLGIEEALLPASESEAVALAGLVGKRQIRPTPEGQELARQLSAAMETLYPFEGYGNSLMHFFLGDTIFGANIAEVLQLPPVNWTRWLVRARAAQKRTVLHWLVRVPGAVTRRRFIARRFAQRMIAMRRPDGRVPFEVPPGLLERWGIAVRA